jgi:hypothetical protein
MPLPLAAHRAPFAPVAFAFLPLGAVTPAGWLRRQLEIQSGGLTGHLEEFWPDLGPESGWLGGPGEQWERGPYYLDGLVPLAYLLGDDALIAKAQKWIDWALSSQRPDGWLGPVHDHHDGRHQAYDAWPLFVLLKALTQYEEATKDPRVVPALMRLFAFLRDNLDRYPLHSWGAFRWADLLISIVWLYDRTGEAWLLDLAQHVHAQGYDWSDHFTNFRFPNKTTGTFDLPTHVVNNAMGIKTPGVWWLVSHDPADRRAADDALANLDRYHGQVTGVFSGDEHLAGREPTQGTELCAVVEELFSLEWLIAITGEPAHCDRLERIAYNALPATFSPDMWAHQYDQQVNQVLCSVAPRSWTNNHDDSNIFGLEPNFGCCTANMHQAWPKFARALWMATPQGGLAAVAYAPSRVSITLASGDDVTVVEETDYPFEEEIRFTIHVSRPLAFPLALRVPAWCDSATVRLGDGERPLAVGAFHVIDRQWNPDDSVMLRLPMRVRKERRMHSAVALMRGPLVFSLKIGEEWRQIGGEAPHADWAVQPTTPWNYALHFDPEHLEDSVAVETHPVGGSPFSPEGAPVRMRVRGRRVPGWQLRDNSAGPVPEDASASEPVESLLLIPYGCTNLRITEFPLGRSNGP